MKYSAKQSDVGHVISLKRWLYKNWGAAVIAVTSASYRDL
jgi:hypothetical protein